MICVMFYDFVIYCFAFTGISLLCYYQVMTYDSFMTLQQIEFIN